MNAPDPFSQWDAAYVLGALSVADRRVYEEHLAECPQCRTAVTELAGMPGLLAGLPAADAVALGDHTQPEPGAADLPTSVARMRTPRRFGRLRLPLLLAVLVALVVGVGIGAVGGYLVTRTPPPSAVRVAFSPLHPTPMIAVADLLRTGDRTEITIDCQYAAGGSYTRTVDYALTVVGKDGRRRPGTRWSAGPGDRRSARANVALPLSEIEALEIDYADSGKPVMRATL
ncbi:anti-sigma factor family protein [Microlunatus soli]|uniref:Putative zinc-finger n=1 Tax=Microlunatus soli TaxID=630515 RepID=A0A1H1Y7N8_9ACTN|nr:zf-HC2 domain-containing protein [Microlunatus soli]SDT17385.1 Putative zinc-finger [Microlunatus soli]